jgi:hypothetical protein
MTQHFSYQFSQLLSKPKFSVLEKIKTIGSTYMVAAGLQPGKEGERAVSLLTYLYQTIVKLKDLKLKNLKKDQTNQCLFGGKFQSVDTFSDYVRKLKKS